MSANRFKAVSTVMKWFPEPINLRPCFKFVNRDGQKDQIDKNLLFHFSFLCDKDLKL